MLIRVMEIGQAEHMRQIRNSCRQFMTNDQREISVDDQQRWFQSIIVSDAVLPFLYQPQADPIGYGLLRRIDDRWWVSGGLLPDHRGRGHGRALFAELAAYVEGFGETCWLTVFESNIAARRTYETLGFVFIERTVSADDVSAIITMKRVRP